MPEDRDGNIGTYQTYQRCQDPRCPAIQPGTEHTHFIHNNRKAVLYLEQQGDNDA